MKKRNFSTFAVPYYAFILSIFWNSQAQITPNPIITRGQNIYTSGGEQNDSNLADGDYGNYWVPTKMPAWQAFKIKGSPKKLLLYFKTFQWGTYEDAQHTLNDYQIQVSDNSTNGIDGTWEDVITKKGNNKSNVIHTFDFSGNKWVRLHITKWSREDNHGGLSEIDIHDVSNGTEDTYIFLGNSITEFSYFRWKDRQPDFSTNIQNKFPLYQPAMISAGIGGVTASFAADNIDKYLADNPNIHYWCLAYGTNDSWGDTEGKNAEEFGSTMKGLIQKIIAKGKIPIIQKIPYAQGSEHLGIPFYNEKISTLTKEFNLITGPDMYTWFLEHQKELRDGVHPTETGALSIHKLWATVMEPLYRNSTPTNFKNKHQDSPLTFNNHVFLNLNIKRMGITGAKILNLHGKLITNLSIKKYPLNWTGTGRDGQSVAPGIYILHLNQGESSKSFRFLKY